MARRGLILLVLLGALALAGLPPAAEADPCVDSNPTHAFDQTFPSTGTEVTRWSVTVCAVGRYGLVLGPTRFRTAPGDGFVQIFEDARVSDIFVRYHDGVSFFDVRDFSSGLMTLSTVECPAARGTLILGNLACKEIRDRGLAFRTTSSARRGEDVVVWGVISSGTYKYMIEWRLRDDGVVAGRVGATGRNLPGHHEVPHVHLITWRLDVDLDGAGGDFVREFTHAESSADQTSRDSSTLLTTETGRSWTAGGFRYWTVFDSTLRNAQNNRTGYRLIPSRSGVARHEDQPFAMKDFWVTAQPDNKLAEMFAGNLPLYVENAESINGTDIVLWYSAPIHHVPRDEDDNGATQLMGEEFLLVPQNLFDASPLP